jgi:hypothetical protein
VRYTQVTKHVTAEHKLPTIPVRVLYLNRKWDPEIHNEWEVQEGAKEISFHWPQRSEDQQAKAAERSARKREAGIDASDPEEIDAHILFNDFLEMDTAEDALAFLRKYGNPCDYHEFADTEGMSFEEEDAYYSYHRRNVTLAELRKYRDFLKEAAVIPLHRWESLEEEFDIPLHQDARVILEIQDGVLVGTSSSDATWDMFSDLLFIEKAAGAEFRLCQRIGCKKVFRVESQHSRKYCCSDCAHLAAVQAWRERVRNKKSSRKSRASASKKSRRKQ